MGKAVALAELAEAVPAGSLLAIPGDASGPAIAATLELIRRRTGELRLVTAPTSGLQADLLIGAGLVREVETAGITLGEWGQAERFRAAVAAGLPVKDATCPALHAGFQAAEKGIPFIPLRGLLGTDLLAGRPDWEVIRNPLSRDDDAIVVLPAIRPDVALFHAALADEAGNVWVGVRREVATLAHAARRTLVTVEALTPGNLLEDPLRAPGTLPHLYVDKVAVVPGGTWPLPFRGQGGDAAALARYAQASRDQAGFDAVVEDWLHGRR